MFVFFVNNQPIFYSYYDSCFDIDRTANHDLIFRGDGYANIASQIGLRIKAYDCRERPAHRKSFPGTANRRKIVAYYVRRAATISG